MFSTAIESQIFETPRHRTHYLSAGPADERTLLELAFLLEEAYPFPRIER